MSEETTQLVGDEPPEYAAIRPSGHYLMLLLRAAVADDGHGGPWLYVYRTATPGGSPIYTHHITTSTITRETYSTESRALMISGDDALAFAAENRWPATSIVDPTVAELRALGTYAVEAEQLEQWHVWHSAWIRGESQRTTARDARAARARAAARGLRWLLAEQWLRIPTE